MSYYILFSKTDRGRDDGHTGHTPREGGSRGAKLF